MPWEVEERVRWCRLQVDLVALQFAFEQLLRTNTPDLLPRHRSQLESVALPDVLLDRLADILALHDAVRFEASVQVHDQLGAAIAVLCVDDVGHLRDYADWLRSMLRPTGPVDHYSWSRVADVSLAGLQNEFEFCRFGLSAGFQEVDLFPKREF